MRLVFAVLWKIYFFIVFFILLVLFSPILRILYHNPKNIALALKFTRIYAKITLFLVGIQVNRLPQYYEFPSAPFIICSNHSSYLDIVLMYVLLPQSFVFMAKKELGNYPLFNLFFRKGFNILVDRQSRTGSHKSYIDSSNQIKNGVSAVIFPEATIPQKVPKMRPFKNGAVRLAIEHNIPIVPITFLDNFKRVRSGKFFKVSGGPGNCRVLIHEPLYPTNFTENQLAEFNKELFNTINFPLVQEYGDLAASQVE